MSKQKEIKQLQKKAERQGWTVSRTNGDHLKWVSPSGKVIFCALTPSDVRSIRNHTSMLRRHGFVNTERR